MTTEQQRKMLEAAAKACGLRHVDYSGMDYDGSGGLVLVNENGCHTRAWNPRAIAIDTAEMCAELGICTLFFDNEHKVSCGFLAQDKEPTLAHIEPYGDSSLKAWMYAATMCAAKTQGYSE